MSPKFYDDVFLRGGPLGAQPSSIYTDASVGTDSRRRVVGNFSAAYAHDVLGGYSKEASVSLDLRPTSNIRINLGPRFSQLHDMEQYRTSVADPLATNTYGRRYVLATLTQNTLSLDTRLDVTFSPTLSFVMYAQPFVSAGRYEDFREFLRPGETDFAVYGRDRGTIAYDATNQRYVVDPDAAGPAPSFNVN